MGTGQRPVPQMTGWNIETRGESFYLFGPGGNEFDDRDGLPFCKTEAGWWVAGGQLRAVRAALELVQISNDRYWTSVMEQAEAARPGSGFGPDRGVGLVAGSGPDGAGEGLVFTGLPEHAWKYARMRSLEFTYAELPGLTGAARAIAAGWGCETGPVISTEQARQWALEDDVRWVEQMMRLRMEQGAWPPGALIPPPGALVAILDRKKDDRDRIDITAVRMALERLAERGWLSGEGPMYLAPQRLPDGRLNPAAPPEPPGVRRFYRHSNTGKVYEALRARISDGDLPPGALAPTANEVAGRYQVGQAVASNALRMLTEDGWIEPGRGRGRRYTSTPAHADRQTAPS